MLFKDIKSFFLQLIKFSLVGVINTLLTIIVIFILINIFLFNDYLSNIIGYIIGFINSFVLNKLWTFKSKQFSKRELLFFILIFIITYGIQFLFLNLLLNYFKIYDSINFFSINSKTYSLKVAHLIAMVIYTILNFMLNKYITFKKEVNNV